MTSQTETTPSETPQIAVKPGAIAYNVRTGSDKRKYWSRNGVEFDHKDGKGSTIILDTIPFDGRIVVRERADADADESESKDVPAEGSAEKTGRRAPDMLAYSIRMVGRRAFWTEIGIVYKHKAGKGKTIQLHAMPRDYRVTLRDRSETVAKEPETAADPAS